MEKFAIIRRVVLVSLVMSIATWSLPLTNAAEQPVKETTHRVATTAFDTVAANSVDDTLKDCLARIPEVATPGQRLLAEQNCRGEERMRQEMQVTPSF